MWQGVRRKERGEESVGRGERVLERGERSEERGGKREMREDGGSGGLPEGRQCRLLSSLPSRGALSPFVSNS